MRIAFLNRGREAFPGGDVIALDATMEALRARGHVADEVGWVAEKLADYDICHMFHCNFSWSWGNYQAIKQAKKPYVLTPIYYPGPVLSGITSKSITEVVEGAERVLPFSPTEHMRLYAEVRTLSGWNKATVLPNGTAQEFHYNAMKGRVFSVLAVAARSGDKNIDKVRKICAGISGADLKVASAMTRNELASVYRHTRLFINASESERMSLTIGEALCSGCRVLATDRNWGNSWYPGLVTFNPGDDVYMEHLIRWALASTEWDYRPNDAAHVLTWDWVAEKLEAVYRSVLNG